LLRQLKDPSPDAEQFVFSPDGRVLAVGGSGFATLWDPATGKKLRRVGPGPDTRTDEHGVGISFSADGTTLALAAHGRITLWDARTGKPALALPGHQGAVASVLFARDGKSLASLAAGEVRLWDAATGAETGVLPRPASPVAAFSAGGTVLTYKSEGDTV
jgi:WD40 repeat protein